jgi:uncharacterized protein
MKISRLLLAAVLLFTLAPGVRAAEKIRALIIDGQNNHQWAQTTPWIKFALEQSGRFTVDVSTTPGSGPRAPREPKDATPEQKEKFLAEKKKWEAEKRAAESEKAEQWKSWHPKFSNYDVVVSNYNGEMWPDAVREDFVSFVRNGGGFVSVHAADNSFPQWPEYNEMIGVGGWGGRNEKSGPYLRLRDGKWTEDTTPGPGGSHGKFHSFVVETRAPEHPIMRGLPEKWMHAPDELYNRLRGPAKNVTVLASADSVKENGGSGENEPMLMVTRFGKGRCFHTTLGHAAETMAGLGFQITLARGAEWVATGKVTIPAPKPGELTLDKPALRPMPAAK